jgi:hypothetical protein
MVSAREGWDRGSRSPWDAVKDSLYGLPDLRRSCRHARAEAHPSLVSRSLSSCLIRRTFAMTCGALDARAACATSGPSRLVGIAPALGRQLAQFLRVRRVHLAALLALQDIVHLRRQDRTNRVNGIVPGQPLPLQSAECVHHDRLVRCQLVFDDRVECRVQANSPCPWVPRRWYAATSSILVASSNASHASGSGARSASYYFIFVMYSAVVAVAHSIPPRRARVLKSRCGPLSRSALHLNSRLHRRDLPRFDRILILNPANIVWMARGTCGFPTSQAASRHQSRHCCWDIVPRWFWPDNPLSAESFPSCDCNRRDGIPRA